MVAKKSPQANLENKRTIPVLMGFVMVLSLLFIVFEWSRKELNFDKVNYSGVKVIDDDPLPITMPEKPLPPPPPPAPISDFVNVIPDEAKPTTAQPITDATPVDAPGDITKTTYETGGEEIDEIVGYVEEMPEFKGDVMTYLAKNLKYPAVPQDLGIQGRVICQFVINKDGSIVDIQVVRSVDKHLDNEAIRVIKSMPNWKPGRMNGKPVRVKYTLPVNFRLM